MEHSLINDFYFKLKATNDKDDKFTEYLFAHVSDNFCKATNISPLLILGKKISEIVKSNENLLGLNEYYFNLIPNTRSKYTLFIKELKRLYLINIFAYTKDEEEFLIIFYSDITDIRKKLHYRNIKLNERDKSIYYIKNRTMHYYKDNLTNLYNKSYFENELIRLDTKRQLPISIIMGDINGLKLFNDAFGHSMGDKILKKAAEIMISSFRQEDIISRVGGDEFVVLLPKTTQETAMSIIDRIKNDCEKNQLDIIKINISFGAATKESENENLNDILKKAEERMYFKKLRESKAAKRYIIDSLRSKLEKITFETKAHYERLKQLCLTVADELGLTDNEKEELLLLCEFHDIGKIGISENILQKEEGLNPEEWDNIKRHSEIGYYIAKEFREASPIDELILTHHERWDGKGYPGLLKDKEIPVVARVFAIADAYEAMVNGRPYRKRMTSKEALNEIREKSGTQFDPYLAQMFVEIMDRQK